MDSDLLLVFTIDTECSVLRQPNPNPDTVVDELIFGDFGDGGQSAGIGLHMDLLEQFGFRGSFFVDVLMEFEHGQGALERTVEAILQRGHEVELHVHPEHLRWSRDPTVERLAGELSGGRALRDADVFRRLMELSVDLFERRVGRRPIAYRAGAYRISDIQFPVLEEFDIRIDSSVQPYFNSQVAEWMRARTQPFRVGGVLEVPPTYFVLNEKPGQWETRGFTPNSHLGDLISAMPVEYGTSPQVATFVSHSFQLLHCHNSKDAEEVEAYAQRLRSSLTADRADMHLRGLHRAVRTFGEEVDDRLVAAVAGILRRVADRPDACCTTYAELAELADRFWPGEYHPAIDPVPLVDRNHGTVDASGTRVFCGGLLSHLDSGATPGFSSSESGDADQTGWSEELERSQVDELYEHLRTLVGSRRTAPICFRTLGVLPPDRRGVLPPLAELLFPAAMLAKLPEKVDLEGDDVLAWDAATFRAWLVAAGFQVAGERRVPRDPSELARVEAVTDKLRWLDPLELRTAAIEVTLLPSVDLGPYCQTDESLRLREFATNLFESTSPGCHVDVAGLYEAGVISPTTALLTFMRAGFEILAREGSGYRLLRPLELVDIRRFAGIA